MASLRTFAQVGGLALAVCAVSLSQNTFAMGESSKKGTCMKIDNADFYKDGKFDQAKAKDTYYQLMKNFNFPVYERLLKEPGFFWVLDFAQGDFASIGMGGVFWINEPGSAYLGHEIFLLPWQSIAEHRHLPTMIEGKKIPAKGETWQVRYGSVYGFSEVGEPNLDQFPEVKARIANSQLPHLKSMHVEKWEATGDAHVLPKLETWHFMMGGPEGAIVTEYGSFHDMQGLRFSIPNASL